MALSPEDILAKRFQVTKFREGYDQDEVDDYLDDIVVESSISNKAQFKYPKRE